MKNETLNKIRQFKENAILELLNQCTEGEQLLFKRMYSHNAGTGEDSWFTLQKARSLVNYEIGQRIVEHDGVNILWEIL